VRRTISDVALPALLAALLPALLATACGKDEPATGPPEIAYGESVCSRCGMILSEPRFASALRLPQPGGESRVVIFDDIGELFLTLVQPGAPTPAEIWVHDAATEKWIDGRRAFYVRGDIRSPMGLGVEAHADKAVAQRRASEVKGEAMDFESLTRAAASGHLRTN
jgi:copper chaperone NosL